MTTGEGGSSERGRPTALAVLLGVLFLTFLDTTIVSVTLGDLETDVSAGVVPLQWVINAYALVFAAFMLLGGSLGDRFGRKRVMLAGVLVFAAGSVVCALASGVVVVIVGRAVMGLGAAAAEPGTLSVIRQLYPGRAERARALGAWSAVSGLALALGPVIGGLLVSAGGWRSVFWFNLVLAVVLAVAVGVAVPETRDPVPGRLDLPGVAVGAVGLGAVIYAAISGEYRGFGTWWVVLLFVTGAACLLGFGPLESRTTHPILDVAYVRRPVVGGALFAAFAVYFGVFAIFFFTALYLDVGLHYSGLRLAGVFAPMAAAIVVGGVAAGRWVARAGTRVPMTCGCVLAAVGMLLARYELGRSAGLTFALLALALALAGLGFGITVVPLTSAVLGAVPGRRSGMAASATNTARQLGAVVGVAALGAVVNGHLTAAVDQQFSGPLFGSAHDTIVRILETGGGQGTFDIDDIPAPFVRAFLDGLQVALLVATVLMVLAALVAAAIRAQRYPDAEDRQTGSTFSGSAPPSTASTGSP